MEGKGGGVGLSCVGHLPPWLVIYRDQVTKGNIKRWKWALGSLFKWMQEKNIVPICTTELLLWANDVRIGGNSQDVVYTALVALDAVLTAQNRPKWGQVGIYQTLEQYNGQWRDECGMDTYVAGFEEVERLAESPPPHVNPKAWRGKHHVASTFGLRHGEVNRVDPDKDIRYMAVQDMWEVTIRDPEKARKNPACHN